MHLGLSGDLENHSGLTGMGPSAVDSMTVRLPAVFDRASGFATRFAARGEWTGRGHRPRDGLCGYRASRSATTTILFPNWPISAFATLHPARTKGKTPPRLSNWKTRPGSCR